MTTSRHVPRGTHERDRHPEPLVQAVSLADAAFEPEAGPAPRRAHRAMMASLAGVVAAAYATTAAYTINAHMSRDARSDYDQVWAAARFLWRGLDPYVVIGPHADALWQLNWPMLYPLSTIVAMLPLAALPVDVARALFVGASFALLAWTLTRVAWWPLLLLLAFPAIQAAALAQWTPLLVGAGLLHRRLGDALLVLKPQDGVIWLVTHPSWRRMFTFLGTGALLGAAAWALRPGWLLEWRTTIAQVSHFTPFLTSPLSWPVLALAALHWRTPAARLIVAMCLVPLNHAMYTMLPAGLAARSLRQMMVFVACSLLGEAARRWYVGPVPHDDLFMAVGLWPATALVWWNGPREVQAVGRRLARRVGIMKRA